MHIAIDYRPALGQSTGIGRYTRGLIKALARLDNDNKYSLLTSCDFQVRNEFPANFNIRKLPVTDYWLTILWNRFHLPLYVEYFLPLLDIFHSPNFVLPPLRQARSLLTIHDLSFIRFPHGAEPTLKKWLERAVPHSLLRADRILADSENTRRDLIEIYQVEPEKVTIVGAGVDDTFMPITDEEVLERTRSKYRLPRRFILGLGTLEPRKNFEGLIKAFEKLSFGEIELVIAGSKGWLYENIFRCAAASKAQERIHFIGFVEEADLPALYSLADIFVFPSYYEGFGIPVLEAMACGLPVICANNSSLPEVAADAAIYFDAEDINSISEAMNHLLTNQEERNRLSACGRQRIRSFSWEAAAQKLSNAYQLLGVKA